MSFSGDNIEKFDLDRTPSPGGDYTSLLNDSSLSRYNTTELDRIREYSPIEPNSKQDLREDIQKLRSENMYLKAQLEIASKEKELHIQSNAQERIKIKKIITNMKSAMHNDLVSLKKENQELVEKNAELVKRLQKLQSIKVEKAEFYKKQLESQENHYQILLNDKDRVINALKKEVQDKKTQKTATHKKRKSVSRRLSVFPSEISTPKSSTLSLYSSPKHKLDEISQLIVKLEKEQAELKESAPETEYMDDFYDNTLLHDLTKDKRSHLGKSRTHKDLYLRSRMSTEF